MHVRTHECVKYIMHLYDCMRGKYVIYNYCDHLGLCITSYYSVFFNKFILYYRAKSVDLNYNFFTLVPICREYIFKEY